MRFGAFTYAYSTNLGDEMQTLAALQFLPRVDVLLERDRLHWYEHDPETFIIFNGWFTHQPKWPPPASLVPCFVSFYANMPDVLIQPKFASYFKNHEPIGCRSPVTAQALKEIGVKAYFSGCLTLTLKAASVEKTGRVYAVDVERSLYRRLIPARVQAEAIELSHEHPHPRSGSLERLGAGALEMTLRTVNRVRNAGISLPGGQLVSTRRHGQRVQLARRMLSIYAGARLVITSRLHCALPCLAVGTPVILLRDGVQADPRFRGLRDLVRTYDGSELRINIDWDNPDPNPESFMVYARDLEVTCRSAVERATCVKCTDTLRIENQPVLF